jgi:flagellar hook-length control protein FliK
MIAPLRRDADGVHRLTVHLHPADLGPVSILAEIRDGAIQMTLAGTTETGRDTLRASLPELRRELEQAGFTGCSLDMRQDSPAGGRSSARGSGVPTGSAGSTSTAGGVADGDQPASGRLDLHL